MCASYVYNYGMKVYVRGVLQPMLLRIQLQEKEILDVLTLISSVAVQLWPRTDNRS